jgi:hypothetical protein
MPAPTRIATRSAARALLALAALACLSARAAGGHHGIDDAQLLRAGECELETWATRDSARTRLLHTGASCRVGPLEIGLDGEHARLDGGASATAWAAEAKWARELDEQLGVGVLVQPSWQAHERPRYQGTAVIALASWAPRADLTVHVNLGRDLLRAARDRPRGGAALEWLAASGWTLVAERYLEEDTHFVRAGVRWQVGEHWSLDLSRAVRLAGPNPSNWTLGLTLPFTIGR